MCFVMILMTNSFANFKGWVKIIVAWKIVSRALQPIQKYFEIMCQFVLVFNPFRPSGNKRLNILKQICSFHLQICLWLFWPFVTTRHERINYLENKPLKNVYSDNGKKKLKQITTSRRLLSLPSLQLCSFQKIVAK